MESRPALDLDALRAIDVHTHCEVSASGHRSLPDHLVTAAEHHFRSGDDRPLDLPSMAGYYRARDLACVVFTIDAEAALGHTPIRNEEVLRGAAEHPDVFIGFASVDPARGAAAIDAAERLVTEHGARGFKFHPTIQRFAPDDRAHYPLYEAIDGLGVPTLFHSGQTGIGAGLPGGGGFLLGLSNPMRLDAVAADFPDLQIVIAHPSFPWQEEALAVAHHKANVWIDLSGWAPKYFPPLLVRYAGTLLRDRVLFGSDYPMITPDRWLREFEDLPIADEVRPAILKHNAARLLGLT